MRHVEKELWSCASSVQRRYINMHTHNALLLTQRGKGKGRCDVKQTFSLIKVEQQNNHNAKFFMTCVVSREFTKMFCHYNFISTLSTLIDKRSNIRRFILL
jgi:hypothetical protein